MTRGEERILRTGDPAGQGHAAFGLRSVRRQSEVGLQTRQRCHAAGRDDFGRAANIAPQQQMGRLGLAGRHGIAASFGRRGRVRSSVLPDSSTTRSAGRRASGDSLATMRPRRHSR